MEDLYFKSAMAWNELTALNIKTLKETVQNLEEEISATIKLIEAYRKQLDMNVQTVGAYLNDNPDKDKQGELNWFKQLNKIA